MITEKPIEQITSADLEQLVTNGVGESRTLEYKEALPGGADQDKRQFLADVSFANAIGGDLVYGARESRDQEGIVDAVVMAQQFVDPSVDDRFGDSRIVVEELIPGHSILRVSKFAGRDVRGLGSDYWRHPELAVAIHEKAGHRDALVS